LSRLPTSMGSHQSLLPRSATTWMQATCMALILSATTPYVLVRIWGIACAALSFFMHPLWCSLNVSCATIQMQSHPVACLLNRTNQCRTFSFAVSFGRRCFLWPRLPANSAASVFAVSNCSPPLLAHSMLFAVHLSSIVTTLLTSLLLLCFHWPLRLGSPGGLLLHTWGCLSGLGMPEWPGTQWISIAMPWARRACALRLIHLATRCPGPGSRCAVRRMAACESLTTTVSTPCLCIVSLFAIITSSASPIAHSPASKTSIRPKPR